MMKNEERAIQEQREQVFGGDSKVDLIAACTVSEGIIRLSPTEEQGFVDRSPKNSGKTAFFIPASGSGSRMFECLYNAIGSERMSDEVAQFLQHYNVLALSSVFPKREHESDLNFLKRLLDEDGINLGGLPKGLIPFHREGKKVFTPFLEHVRQAQLVFDENCEVHFSVQQEFEQEIHAHISTSGITKPDTRIHFSHQLGETDAYCFGLDQKVYVEDGKPLRRPAGHGALLQNLNAVNADIVLIKNIDNIQHWTNAMKTVDQWKVTLGLLEAFRQELVQLKSAYSKSKIEELNERFQFLSQHELQGFSESDLDRILARPTRVCGMVKNEGEPGGGPFWVRNESTVTKQIVEKVQIRNQTDQQQILQESSHFNPVFIAISKNDAYGNRLNLHDFVDHSNFLVVEKPHKGDTIKYRELPGLWNGAMGNWNTLFLEIPSTLFSPVKSVLDLFKPLHLDQ